MAESVKINIVTLKAQVEEGKKKDELAKIYGLSVLQMGKALKQAGLKIRKFHAPAFELVSEENNVEVVGETVVEPVADASPETEVATAEDTDGEVAEDTTSDVTWKA